MSRLVIFVAFVVQVASAQFSPPKPTNTVTVFAIPDEYLTIKGANSPQGFLMDFLKVVQKKTNLQFTVIPHPELSYDRPNEDGTWDGTLIGEVSKDFPTADLVGPDLTISAEGKKVVDFLEPIRNYNLQILVNPKFGLSPRTQYLSIDDADLASLKNHKNATLKKIYESVKAGGKSSIVDSNAAGVAKVLKGNFAYIGESVYFVQALKQNAGKVALVGGNLGNQKSLGFAVKKGSPLKAKLNDAIKQLKQAGVVDRLFSKYNL